MKPHDPTSTPASSGRHPEAVRGIRIKAVELASLARARGIMCGKSDQDMMEFAGLIESFIGRGTDEELKIRSWAIDMVMDNAGGKPIAARQMYDRAQRIFDYVYGGGDNAAASALRGVAKPLYEEQFAAALEVSAAFGQLDVSIREMTRAFLNWTTKNDWKLP